MNQTWLVTGFFFALLLVIIYGAFLILSPFLKAITWALILAILFYPFYAWLLGHLRGRATLASLIVIFLIAVLVIAPGIQLAWFLSEEAILLVQTVRSLLNPENGSEWRWQSLPWIQTLLSWWDRMSFQLVDLKINWKDLLIQGAQSSSSFLVGQVKGIAQNVLLFTVNSMITLVTLFFFLRDGADFIIRIQRLLPMDRTHLARLFKNIVDAVVAVVHGSLVVAMLQGLLAGLAYWLLDVPFAVLWGVVSGFAALLPVGGSTLVTIPVSIYLFFQGGPVRGVILLIWSLAIVGTVDNVLKPLLIGNRLRLPVLLLFFGILGGISLFGAVGLILGPTVFALLRALLEVYSEAYSSPEQS